MAHRKPATKLPLTLTLLLDTFSGPTAFPLVPFSLQSRALSLFASSNLGLQSQCRLHVNCCLSVEHVSIAHFVFAVAAETGSLMSGFPTAFRFLEYFFSFHPRNCEVFSSQEVHTVQRSRGGYPDTITINQC